MWLIQSTYEDARSRVCVGCNRGKELSVKVGVHQGSWTHKKCSGIPGPLKPVRFSCKCFTGQTRPIDGRLMAEVTVGEEELEVVPSFCYLGDCWSSGGGCELTTITRYYAAWGKFNELVPVLTSRSFPITSRGKNYNSCVRSAMPHPNETWGQPYPTCIACNAMTELWFAACAVSPPSQLTRSLREMMTDDDWWRRPIAQFYIYSTLWKFGISKI